MTDEEYRAIQEERQRLLNQYNSLETKLYNLKHEAEVLKNELSTAMYNIEVVNNNIVSSAKTVLPLMDTSVVATNALKDLTDKIYKSIVALRDKSIQVKNISISSKKLTELDDIYNRKYRFFVKLRKIALGYVIGIDSNIISSETLRTEVEKQQLKNSDYWLSYALSSLMLWFSNEKDASYRGVEKALKMDHYKAVLFYMLINLRFGRPKVAQKWYELFADEINIFNVKDEFEYVLQAYLHHAFTNDHEFDIKVRNKLATMLNEMKTSIPGYENKIINLVLNFAKTYPYNTSKEYTPLYEYCKDYDLMISNLTNAEKNVEIMKYYLGIYDEDDTSADSLKENIENVLYDLISEYDSDEKEIFKQIKYHEYVVKANGDIALAKEAYDLQYPNKDDKTSLDMLMFKFAFSDLNSKIDPRLRKFAITFLIEQIKAGYQKYRENYLSNVKEKYAFEIFGIDIEGNENTEKESFEVINTYYKKNRHKIVYKDKKVKVYRAASIISIVGLAIVITISILIKSFPIGILVPFLIFVLGCILFVLLWVFRAKKVAQAIEEEKAEAFKILHNVNESLVKYKEDFNKANSEFEGLIEALNKFEREE